MRYFIFILFTCYSSLCVAQTQRCSTDEYRENLKEKGLFRHHKTHVSSNNIHAGNYVIPVVVHVLYNNEEENISDDRIYSQIETLNTDYNAGNTELSNVPTEFASIVGNVGVSFCLVEVDLDGNSFSGINRVYTDVLSFNMSDDSMKKSSEGGVDAWDSNNYLNFWVCNLSGNLLGFATMPGDVEPELDGVVIDFEYFGVNIDSASPYNLGRTATHEIGHYLGLEHTFYAGCSDWDGCDDTPSTSSPNYGCPAFPQESCSTIDMTMNYMDYVNDACMYMFTECQANIMINSLVNLRSDLIASTDCSVSINDLSSSSILVYPNPVEDKMYIEMNDPFVSVFDIYGRHILSKDIQNSVVLDVSYLASGTYFLFNGDGFYRFVKQ